MCFLADRRGHIRALPVLVALFASFLTPGCMKQTTPEGYDLPYGEGAFLPSELRLDGADLLEPGALAGSAACGGCHPSIYLQWQSSLHRASAIDPNARFAIDQMGRDYGLAASRLCEACHQPGAVLAGTIDATATPDQATLREGISCLSCHLVSEIRKVKAVGVAANASMTYELLERALLLPDPTSPKALSLHGEALRRPWLSENRACAACHRFFVPTQMGGSPEGRLRLQSQEAEGTVFADPDHPDYRSCVDCHMPLVEGTDPAAKDGRIHDHRSLGSNLLVPMLLGDTDQVEATKAFRREGAVDLEIRALKRVESGQLALPVVLHNRRNGHDFPSGATDISETWVELVLKDAQGGIVYRSPGLDEERYLSPDAPSLTTAVALKGGDLDYLHDLFSQISLVQYPRVPAGGSWTLDVPVRLAASDEARLPLTAHVSLRARHGNERWNRWAFNYQDVEVPVADIAEASGQITEIPPALVPVVAQQGPPASRWPAGMVYVPGGSYLLGADPSQDPEARLNEFPPHRVSLDPFFIDRVPVTNRMYAAAVADGWVNPPEALSVAPLDRHGWPNGTPPAGLEDHPVVLVSYDEATEFCEGFGKRLPTEAEWEAAARGPEGRRYAWGDTFAPELCNTAESGRLHSVPVGSSPGNASPFGALDMGCNVSEWTGGRYGAYPRTRHIDNRHDWQERYTGYYSATHGASYEMLGWRARASYRGEEEATASNTIQNTRKLIGFRCAMDAGP